MANATKYFKVTQIRSDAGRLPIHRRTIKGLGLGKVWRTVELPDTVAVRGMITSVQYLLKVEPVAGSLEKKQNPTRAKRKAGEKKATKAKKAA